MARTVDCKRKTNETNIELTINLDGTASGEISTGIGFFDHMLTLFKVHSGFDLSVKCVGDIDVDFHHSVEDVGIVLGESILKALGKKVGIERFSNKIIPMDDSVAQIAVDLSGRNSLIFKPKLEGKVGDFDAELTEEFFRAIANNLKANIYVDLLSVGNMHHNIEAIFKCFARCLKEAVKVTGTSVPSSKGSL